MSSASDYTDSKTATGDRAMKYADKLQNPESMMYGPTRHKDQKVMADFTDEQWKARCERFGIAHRFHPLRPKQRLPFTD